MANDGNTSTYWEGLDGSGYPQTLTVDLRSSFSLASIVLDLPPSSAWSTRTQTLSVLGSTNDSTFTTIAASAGYTFNPSTGNTVTINLPSGTSARYVQLSFSANTGWSARSCPVTTCLTWCHFCELSAMIMKALCSYRCQKSP
jgi:hypothetical protein